MFSAPPHRHCIAINVKRAEEHLRPSDLKAFAGAEMFSSPPHRYCIAINVKRAEEHLRPSDLKHLLARRCSPRRHIGTASPSM
jgi:hypothetical protein